MNVKTSTYRPQMMNQASHVEWNSRTRTGTLPDRNRCHNSRGADPFLRQAQNHQLDQIIIQTEIMFIHICTIIIVIIIIRMSILHIVLLSYHVRSGFCHMYSAVGAVWEPFGRDPSGETPKGFWGASELYSSKCSNIMFFCYIRNAFETIGF